MNINLGVAELIVINRVCIAKKQGSKLCHQVYYVREAKLKVQRINLDGKQSKRSFLQNQLSVDEIGVLVWQWWSRNANPLTRLYAEISGTGDGANIKQI